MTRKERYRALCDSEKSIPLFSQAWWLDATAGEENWDVVLVESGGEIIASMPYVVRRRFRMVFIGLPTLTQTLGPWIRTGQAKYASRLASEKDLMRQLIAGLPRYDHFQQSWHHSQANWLPFYWAGFKQTTRYTYRLPDLSDETKLWRGLSDNIKGDYKKAIGRFALRIRTDLSVDNFLDLNKKTFERQRKVLPYSVDVVRALDKACSKRNSRQIFIAEDEKGRPHAGVYIVWDTNTTYYLMGGGDPELRRSGATSLCLWEAIKFASTVSKSFDFEGSMIEPVERFFRAFGAQQVPYFSVSRTPSKLLQTLIFLRSVWR